MMKFENCEILFVTGNVFPYNGINGSHLTTFCLLNQILLVGGKVTVLTFPDEMTNDSKDIFESNYKLDINNLSIYGEIGANRKLDKISNFNYVTSVDNLLNRKKYDYIILYDWISVEIFNPFFDNSDFKFITITVDLCHLVAYQRFKNYFFKSVPIRAKIHTGFKYLLKVYKYRKFQKMSLSHSSLVNINQAFHHSQWLKKKGVNVKYLPLFLDFGTQNQLSNRIIEDKFSIMLIGGTKGIISIRTLETLFNVVIPNLEKKIKNSFVINYCGQFNYKDLPGNLIKKINKADCFNIKGYVDSFENEVNKNSVFLVASDLKIGFRTRIAEAMAYGALIIVHQSNLLGMPELINYENVIVAKDQRDIYRKIIEVYNMTEIEQNRIRKNALNTYLKSYYITETFTKFNSWLN